MVGRLTYFSLIFVAIFFQDGSYEHLGVPRLASALHTPSTSSLQYLASGSDIRGAFTLKSPGLTPGAAYRLGKALAETIASSSSLPSSSSSPPSSPPPTIMLGRDPRPHGTILAKAFARGASSAGAVLISTGLATTPAMFHAVRTGAASAGVMITASHLPPDKNGFKVFLKASEGGPAEPLSKEQRDAFLELASTYPEPDLPVALMGGRADATDELEEVDFMKTYVSSLVEVVEAKVGTLSGLKLLVNPGCGSGGVLCEVLEKCGADVTSSINVEPDGTFPFGVPNPESKSMAFRTVSACSDHGDVDLGIMLDTGETLVLKANMRQHRISCTECRRAPPSHRLSQTRTGWVLWRRGKEGPTRL